ncbi:CHAT domain-containing protein [Roseivirga seohaensis]|nr:CHAT domain-containing tetratricopeptide repeat protein [Roseivirga seohaensis]
MNISYFSRLLKLCLLILVFRASILSIKGQNNNLEAAMTNSLRVSELLETEDYSKAENLLIETLKLSLSDTLIATLQNQYSMVLGYKGEFESAINHSHKALKLYNKHFGEKNKHTIDALYNLGELHGGAGNPDSLFYYLEKSLELYYENTPSAFADIGLVHNNLAANYRSMEFHRKAIFHFKKAVENWEQVAEQNPDYLIVGYENLGAYLDTDESLSYLQKALDLKIKQGLNPFRSYIEIASKHSSFENYNEALRFYHIGIKLLKPLADAQKETGFEYQYDLATTYSLIAQTHEAMEHYDSAQHYYQAAYDVPTMINHPTWQTRYLTAQANLFRYKGQYKKAVAELLKILPRTANPNDYMFGYVTYSLSKTYDAQGDYENALLYSLFSLRYDAHGNKSLAPDTTIRIFNRNEQSLQSNSATLLSNHAFYLKQLAKQKPKEEEQILQVALQNIEQAVAHFEEVGETEYASLFYKRGFDRAMSIQQSILLDLFEITGQKKFSVSAFRVSEQAKINKTLLYFNDQEVRTLAELPEDIYERDRDFKKRIAEVERSIFKESQKEQTDSTALRNAYNELFQLHKDNQIFEAQLQENFPKYYGLKRNVTPVGLTEIQQQLDEKTATLVYSLHDDRFFIYTITQQDIVAQQFENAAAVREQIAQYRELLLNPGASPMEYSNAAYALHQSLVAPVFKYVQNYKNLLIIPDKEISTIPFETLVTQQKAENSFSGLSYLLHKFRVHYAYSATLWNKQLNETERKAHQFWVGFAPEYHQTKAVNYTTSKEWVSILPGAQEEVEELSVLMNGDMFTGENATKSALLKAGENYKVMHLAMHSTINNDQPMYSSFLFTPDVENDDEQLSVSELYHQNFNTELVVLSACNTGYGRLLPGEGVLSLSQAFTAAGCPATLMSLWMVPDKETKTLMNNFYEGVKTEKSKTEALHLAKTEYLKQANNDRMTHPFYWAGFVLSGNEKAITQPNRFNLWLIVLVALTLVSGTALWRKKVWNKG